MSPRDKRKITRRSLRVQIIAGELRYDAARLGHLPDVAIRVKLHFFSEICRECHAQSSLTAHEMIDDLVAGIVQRDDVADERVQQDEQ